MSSFKDRYSQLNKKQRQAVDTIEGPLLVVAGPGSGKTEILSLRVGKILQETQVLASNILCLTFTESATLNMRKRLTSLIGAEAYRVAIHTFHNFCVEIIQKYPQYFYGGAFFSPADELAQIEAMEGLFEKMPHDHPLSSYHPEQGYVYLRSVLGVISYLKKAGLNPQEFLAILKHNQKALKEISPLMASNLSDRLSKDTIGKIGLVAENIVGIAKKYQADFPSDFYQSLPAVIADSLRRAVDQSAEAGKTTFLSAWKQKYLRKNDDGESVFKDEVNMEKMIAVAELYERYQGLMHEKGLYDFDDMILDVLTALKNNPALRYEIQEQYQYVLVDEFQDTNDAQMKILRHITDAAVYEGRPNIMAVGDDDQAVYKFQGAELSNILNFKKLFKDVEIVTMTDNYRSSQDILDVAMHIIRKGEERLEKIIPEIKKDLLASNKNLKPGNITERVFPTNAHEYHYISREIKKAIEAGHRPEEIAVIARKHSQLQALVPYLQSVGVPIRYEREQDVFKEPHVAELIILAKFICSLADKHQDEADELLPSILSFPFWQLSREDIWKISLEARRGEFGKTWLEVMLSYPEQRIADIAKFLIDLGVRAQSETLEQILDDLIGAHAPLAAESEDDPDENPAENKTAKIFRSPFKEFYFSREKFSHARAEYLTFLSSLRVFVNALREYKSGETLSLKDLIAFVDLHEKNNISLNDQSPFSKLGEAVSLLTSHKAKGLEFETVFVLSCQEEIWAGRKIPNRLALPTNLPIEPAGDTEDDQLRLFYVAITRAKRNLYLTSYLNKEDGESSEKLRFLIAEEGDEAIMKKASLQKLYYGPDASIEAIELPETHEVLTASWLKFHTAPFVGSEEKLLKSLLEDYQMPITHLNNFLDVEKGGPQYFLEQNLLRFPQAKVSSSSYGSAVHRTLESVSLYLKKNNCLPEKEDVLKWFIDFLKREKMNKIDYDFYVGKGVSELGQYYDQNKNNFKTGDIVEFNFKDQGVVVGEAHLTGKIDRIIDLGAGECAVLDYKTGKPLVSWEESDPYKQKKTINYQRQLAYYKILVENSREFSHKFKVQKGVIDFIETKNGKAISLSKAIAHEEVEKLERLISVVYKKIINLDFPDISKYSKDNKGILAFEEDLLKD
ncbi:MAG: ATP-dependent DNA helicase [bacterium]